MASRQSAGILISDSSLIASHRSLQRSIQVLCFCEALTMYDTDFSSDCIFNCFNKVSVNCTLREVLSFVYRVSHAT